jgi:hypothetical protein
VFDIVSALTVIFPATLGMTVSPRVVMDEFIKYTTSESYSNPGQQTLYLKNYVILRACMVNIVELSGLRIENL